MVIWAGNRDTQFLEVIDISHKPRKTILFDNTKLVNFVYQSDLTGEDKYLRRERHKKQLPTREIERDYDYYDDQTVSLMNRKKKIRKHDNISISNNYYITFKVFSSGKRTKIECSGSRKLMTYPILRVNAA